MDVDTSYNAKEINLDINKECGQAMQESEIDKLFELRRDLEKAEHVMTKLSGTGLFIDEFKPAIFRIRGTIHGIDTAIRSFDL